MVVVAVGVVRVPAAGVEGCRIARCRGREIAAINKKPVFRISRVGRVYRQVLRASAVCVVGLAVEASRTKGVTVEVGLSPTLPYVFIASINFTRLRVKLIEGIHVTVDLLPRAREAVPFVSRDIPRQRRIVDDGKRDKTRIVRHRVARQ